MPGRYVCTAEFFRLGSFSLRVAGGTENFKSGSFRPRHGAKGVKRHVQSTASQINRDVREAVQDTFCFVSAADFKNVGGTDLVLRLSKVLFPENDAFRPLPCNLLNSGEKIVTAEAERHRSP